MRFFKLSLIGLCLCMACGNTSPPLAELTLRDALLSEPATILSLPLDDQRRLAQRFELARIDSNHSGSYSYLAPERGSLESQIESMDRQRMAANADALIVGQITSGSNRLIFLPMQEVLSASPRHVLHQLPGALPHENGALTGSAGAIVERLLELSDAQNLIRMEHVPIAAFSYENKIYVNTSWLAVMSSQDSSFIPSSAGQAARVESSSTEMSPHVEDPHDGRISSFEDRTIRPSDSGSYEQCDFVCESCGNCKQQAASDCTKSWCKKSAYGTDSESSGCDISTRASQASLPQRGLLFWLLLPIAYVLLVNRRLRRT